MRSIPSAGALPLIALLFAAPSHAQEGAADSAAAPVAVSREELQGHLDGLKELMETMQGDLDKLKRFKFSGYVQARMEAGETSSDTVMTAGNPYTVTAPNQTRFFIRRARLKTTYDSSPLSQAVVYLDGGQDRTIRLLEAYVTLLDPWTPLHDHQLTVGQFNVPFGYEIERSSSIRELPERSRAENVLFAGERDRGAKLESQWTEAWKTTLAVLNGGGVSSADFPNTDPTRGKDVVGRIRYSRGTVDAAVSGAHGRQVTPLTGNDVVTDRTRVGVDAQLYWQTPRLGGATLRGEWYAGHEVNPDSVKGLIVAPTSANPVRLLRPDAITGHLATDVLGAYVMFVQNFGEQVQIAARWDTYDRNVDVDHDQYERFGVGLNAYWDGFVRATVAYDVIRTDVSAGAGRFRDPKDNLWTFQVQHRF